MDYLVYLKKDMRVKILLPIFVIFFLVIFLIFYKGLNHTNIYTPKIIPNENIPLFKTIEFQSDNEITSKEVFSGNDYYLLNIWASWCIPCRDEHNFLMKLKKNEKIEIIGLNYKDKEKNAKKFLNELGDPYTKILSDSDGTISIEWGAYGVPESFLIHKNKVIKKIIGPLNDSSFKEIERLVK